MSTTRTVKVIPPKAVGTASGQAVPRRRRVAAYARVSTENEEQTGSYELQVRYYEDYIRSHAEWTFVKVYADEGISGTRTENRAGFNEMMADALAGGIDLILTKSVSRFARNTVDSLSAVRTLKEHGVEIFFEKENIWTFDGKGELLITIMSSLAQEESRSISENVKWGIRKRFENGSFSVPYSHFLGYRKGADGQLEVDEEQAKTVRYIFTEYASGSTTGTIARNLEKAGIPSPSGGSRWYAGTVRNILSNEKYKGDALLQKTYIPDFLTKKAKSNRGEIPQYYVENSHEAIVPQELFDFVQARLARPGEDGRRRSKEGPEFTRLVVCADCGSFYGPKRWHSGTAHAKTIWQCNDKFKGERTCRTPNFTTDELRSMVLDAVNTRLEEIGPDIAQVRQAVAKALDTSNLRHMIDETARRMEDNTAELRALVGRSSGMSAEEFNRRYDALARAYEDDSAALPGLNARLADLEARREKAMMFIDEVAKLPPVIEEYSPRLTGMLVERVEVKASGKVTITFMDGSTVKTTKG